MGETGAYYTGWSKPERKTAIQYILTHIYGIEKDGNDSPIAKTAKETQMYWTVFWTLWERAREGWYGKMALKHVNYHMWNQSSVQVRCMMQDAQGWFTRGMGWGGRCEWGSAWGTHVHPWWIQVNVQQNQYSVVK